MFALVTGANGHLGLNLTKELLVRGYRVRASVRSLSDPEKASELRALGEVELVEAELYRPEQLRRAMEGIDVLFHLAASYKIVGGSVEKNDVLRSNEEGAENALRAAAVARVAKVVMTSSIYAVPLTAPGAPPSDESQWAEDLSVPYIRAKTHAERRAWELARELKLDLVTVLPGAICGPGFRRNTPSVDTIECIMRGYFRMGIPKVNFPYVDVRDVAKAHVLAGERDNSNGRYIVCNDEMPSLLQINEKMHEIDPAVPRPLMQMPNFMLGSAPIFDRLYHRLLGTPRVATQEFVATLKGRIYNASNARIKRELNWQQSVTFEQSLKDTMAQIRQNMVSRAA